jgi:hypothetical protein
MDDSECSPELEQNLFTDHYMHALFCGCKRAAVDNNNSGNPIV